MVKQRTRMHLWGQSPLMHLNRLWGLSPLSCFNRFFVAVIALMVSSTQGLRAEPDLSTLVGNYISAGCAELLQKSLSPNIARCRDAFLIKKEGKDYVFMRVVRFHEGASGKIKNHQYSETLHQFNFQVSEDLEGRSYQLELPKGPTSTFELIEENPSFSDIYVKLPGTFDEFFNQALVGHYKNAKGEKFSFEKSGKGVWRNKPMTYQVGYDFVMCSANYVNIHGSSAAELLGYVWERRDSKILIYADSPCEESSEKPAKVIEELVLN